MEPAAEPFCLAFERLEEASEFETRGRTIAESDILTFGGLTGDTHPQHLDAEWAAQSEYGTRIAHGLLMLTTAYGLLPRHGSRVRALRRIDEVTFKAPARIGETVRLRGTLYPERMLAEGVGAVRCACAVLGQGDVVLVRARLEFAWDGTEAL